MMFDNCSVPGADDGTYGLSEEEWNAIPRAPSTRPYEDELQSYTNCYACMGSGMSASNPDDICWNCRDGLAVDPAFLKEFMLYAYLTAELENGLHEQDTSGYIYLDDIPV